jgi:hypothetical protein
VKASRQRIRRVSLARGRSLRQYAKAVAAWLTRPENRRCCVPGCPRHTDDPHHSRGRVGRLLLDERFWRPVCRRHHDRVKDDPTWARAVGLLPPVGQWNTIPK